MKRMTVSNNARWVSAWLCFVASGLSTVGSPDGENAAPKFHKGLVAHYFSDPEYWDGQWPRDLTGPKDDPMRWTFTQYRYSRVEPLINHLFVNRGWFSIRWVGWIDPQPGAQAQGDHEYIFEIWADDGARLILDGEVLIDDWEARWEESPQSWRRTRKVRLAPGKHRLVVEYFQGINEIGEDRDPMKLYWSSVSRGLKRQIVPAAHFSHTEEDLEQVERPPANAAAADGSTS